MVRRERTSALCSCRAARAGEERRPHIDHCCLSHPFLGLSDEDRIPTTREVRCHIPQRGKGKLLAALAATPGWPS